MRKKMVLAALISFMFIFSLQMAEPAAAAKMKKVDSGSITFSTPDSGKYTYSWTTYQRGTSYLKVLGKMYSHKYGESVSMNFYITKVSKKKVKVSGYIDGESIGTHYDRTKLTGARYYWRIFRPSMMTIPTD